MNSPASSAEHETKNEDAKGPKYFVDIEGKEYPWDKDTITVPEIRTLGVCLQTFQSLRSTQITMSGRSRRLT
jgi:hypothetical protein